MTDPGRRTAVAGGAGLLRFGERLTAHEYVGVDRSEAVRVLRERFTEHGIPGGVRAGRPEVHSSRKGPVRESTGDHVREAVAGVSNEEARGTLMPLTKLGPTLGDMSVEIEEDIPFLGIKKGRHSLQRPFDHEICTVHYRPERTLDEMNHINVDRFRPLNRFRNTTEEVGGLLRAGGTRRRATARRGDRDHGGREEVTCGS
jgi:hypothetical protein